jgi:hypothetical protein
MVRILADFVSPVGDFNPMRFAVAGLTLAWSLRLRVHCSSKPLQNEQQWLGFSVYRVRRSRVPDGVSSAGA